jgi:uncharacterized SAM-binding protein YcdF (DUF218 family)
VEERPSELSVDGGVAIVVPGHGGIGRDGVHRISPIGLGLVAEAGRLAERLEPGLVVLTGWSSSNGVSEAEQMRDAWHGPDVELVVETTARTTAENASRTLPVLLEHDMKAAVVVCTPLHLLRVRLSFGFLYRRSGIAVRYHVARVRPTAGAFAWEVAALPLLPVQVAVARREIDRRLHG